jgi:hypothetical protein
LLPNEWIADGIFYSLTDLRRIYPARQACPEPVEGLIPEGKFTANGYGEGRLQGWGDEVREVTIHQVIVIL